MTKAELEAKSTEIVERAKVLLLNQEDIGTLVFVYYRQQIECYPLTPPPEWPEDFATFKAFFYANIRKMVKKNNPLFVAHVFTSKGFVPHKNNPKIDEIMMAIAEAMKVGEWIPSIDEMVEMQLGTSRRMLQVIVQNAYYTISYRAFLTLDDQFNIVGFEPMDDIPSDGPLIGRADVYTYRPDEDVLVREFSEFKLKRTPYEQFKREQGE